MRKPLLTIALIVYTLCAMSQNVGIGTNNPSSKLDINGDISLRDGGVLTPSAGVLTLPAAKNSVYRITAASPTITTISAASGSTLNDGMILNLIFNGPTGSIGTITNSSNNIQTNSGANMVTTSNVANISLMYNASLSLWLVTGSQGMVNVSGSGSTDIYTASGTLFGNRSVNQGGYSLSFGTDAANNTLNLGSTNGTSSTNINGGSGGVNINANTATGPVNIANGSTAGTVEIGKNNTVTITGGAVAMGGSTSPNSSAVLDLGSNTTKGFLPPVVTTAQRNSITSPAQGLTVYNSSTLCIETYIGSSWQPIGCGCSTAPSAPASITASSSTICQGYNGFTFSCPAVLGASAYNWTLPTGASIATGSGTSSITANFSSVAATGSQTVSVAASNSCGTSSAISTSITVNAIPVITSNPSNSTICAYNSGLNTGNTSFSVAATGTGISYQWQVNSGSGWTNVTNGGIYSGATTATLSLTAVTASYSGYQYQCIVSGTCTPAATSSPATLSVNTSPTISGTLAVCTGGTVTLTGSGSPAGSNPWTSSNTSFATVTSGGVVTGVAAGSPVITYTNSNGCAEQATVVVSTSPTISGTLSVCAGATTTLTGTGTPAGSNPWTSSNTAYATVSTGGVVTGVSAGSSVITYTTSSGCSAQATVTVNSTPTISGTLSVCSGSTTSLTGSGTPAGSNPWTSSNTSYATVNTSGVVTGVAAGSPVITYTTSNGCSAQATVTVNTTPTISGTLTVCTGATTTLTGSGTPAASNPWTSSNTSNATVTSGGVVTGVTSGLSVITYTTSNGCSTQATVTVGVTPTISGTLSVCTGSTVNLTGSGTPAGSSPWTSSNTAQATVTSGGIVTGVAAGSPVITYTNSSGCSAHATMTINTTPTISGTLTVCTGASTTLTGSGTPAGTNPWTSSNTSYATVNNSGVVTGVSAGTPVITYTTTNGCSAQATVTVGTTPTISGTLSVCAGSTTTLTGSGTPAGSNPWTSSNTSYATVTTGGVVTGVAAGTSVITYTNNTGCSATATVTVSTGATATASVSSTTVCTGTALSLAGGPAGMTSYSWSGPNSYTSSSQNPTVSSSATAAMAGTYTIKVTNSNGCTASASTSAVSVGYGTNVLDAYEPEVNPMVITTSHPNEVIINAFETFGRTAAPSYTCSSGVTQLATDVSGSYSMTLYGTTAAASGTYTYTITTNSQYWTNNAFSVYNTYGCPLTVANIHVGTQSNTTGTGATTVTSNGTSVPSGSYVGVGAYIDVSSACTPSTETWTGGPSTIEVTTDCDADDGVIGGYTTSSAGTQTVTVKDNSQSGSQNLVQLIWVQYP